MIDPIALLMTQGITPEKIALTLAVGSALALFPIIGTTTLLCLLAGVLLRLNQPIIQLVIMMCATIHFPVIVGLFRMGHWMYGVPNARLGTGMIHRMLDTFWEDPGRFFERFGFDALHAVVAWAVVAPVWIVIVYVFSLPVLREVLRRRIIPVAFVQPIPPSP